MCLLLNCEETRVPEVNLKRWKKAAKTQPGPGPGSFSLPGNCVDPCNARMGARIDVLFIKKKKIRLRFATGLIVQNTSCLLLVKYWQ